MDLKNTLNILRCPNCQILIRPTYATCNYGHLVCPHCKKHSLAKTKTKNKIKKCKSNEIKLTFLDNIFKQMRDNCQYNCGFQGNLLKLRHHESSCKKQIQSETIILDGNEQSYKYEIQHTPNEELYKTENNCKLEIKDEVVEDLSDNVSAMDAIEIKVKQEETISSDTLLSDTALSSDTNITPETDTPIITKPKKQYKKRDKSMNRHFVCDKCGKICKNTGNLKAHLRTHTKVKPNACTLCSKSFNGLSNLKRHIRIHTGEKPFSCHVCGSSFREMGTLTRHLRIHTGAQPYSCNQCGRAFNAASSLSTHLRIHSGVRPFNCNICSKDFQRSTHLKTHMRVHNRVASS